MLYAFLDIIIERKKREANQKTRTHFGRQPQQQIENYDIEDIADGKVSGIGFGIEKKVVQ